MILFSWKKVFYHAKGMPSEIVRIFRMLIYRELPLNRKDPIYKYVGIDFKGDSFLAHPDWLLYNAYKHTNRDLAIYISIASLRPSADYLAHGVLTLDKLHCPVDPYEALEDKTLITLKDGKYHFLYEYPTQH